MLFVDIYWVLYLCYYRLEKLIMQILYGANERSSRVQL